VIRFVTGVVLLEALLLGAWALAVAIRRRPLQPGHVVGVLVLEAALVLHGTGSAVSLLAGHRAAEPGTHAGYLVASVALLPLRLGAPADVRRGRVGVGGSGAPWRAALGALGCVAVAVVLSRMWVTWQPPDA
jgi:hypothetical protein